MDELKIRLHEATENGRLYYQRDPDIEPLVFFLKSPVLRDFGFSINISAGKTILDTDEKRILQHVEFILHRKLWKKVDFKEIPKPQFSSDIEMVNFQSKHKDLNLPVDILTDSNYDYVQINLGSFQSGGVWIALSEQCLAYIFDDHLCGFFVKLVGAPQIVYRARKG